jgi:putative ABC transport system permease protein
MHRSLLDDLRQDVRYMVRTFGKRGVFATAVLILGLGIGGATAIFSVVNGVLLKPLTYPDPEALVRIVHRIGGVEQPYFSDAIYLTYVTAGQAFEDLGVWSPGETATVTSSGEPEEVRVLTASRGVLTTLRVRPEIGRWFSTAEDAPGARDTVMLSSGYWRRRFGGDRRVLERAVNVNGRPHQVVGVIPPDVGVAENFDVILPLRIDPGAPKPGFRLLGVARLKPAITLARANADVARMVPLWVKNPAGRAQWAPALRPLKQDVIGNIGRTLWVLLGATCVVLFMACANVANLLLVRANTRGQEMAVRTALGASRGRIARQLIAESVVLALAAGAVGVAFAYAGLRALLALAPPDLPRLAEIAIDPLVLGFAVAVSVISGLLFGIMLILKSVRGPMANALISGGRATGLAPEQQRVQQLLVAIQIAVALVLLVSAGLMIRSFQALRQVEPGFTQPERVQAFNIYIPENEVREPERVIRLQHALLDAVTAIPGVASVAFTTRLPMGEERSSTALAVEGGEREDERRTPPNRQVKINSPGVFHTLGTPLVAGRDFTWTDVYDMRGVAIISENLARELWGAPAAALGKRVREYYAADSPWREIVGVVSNVTDDGADRPPPPTIYWPAQPTEPLLSMSGYQSRRVSFALRSERAGTNSLLEEVRAAVRSVNANLPLGRVHTLNEIYDRSLARTTFALVLLAVAATMALALGVSGLYSVTAYAVSQRWHEIGVRLAVGAQPHEIRRLFLRWGLILGGYGVAAGIAAAIGLTRLMRSLLFEVSPLDPITLFAVSLLLMTSAVLAAYLPSRSAASANPVETLRDS